MSKEARLNPVEIQVFRHLLAAIPEEMGVLLMRSAFSPNIKERLDFSCALTDHLGEMAAQASHIPVHLGSTHVTAQYILRARRLEPGDLVLVNDPYRGGTHLPDITLFAPIFESGAEEPAFGVMARAHHADVGGAYPGSMGPALDLHGEGLVIPPVVLVRKGEVQKDVWDMVLANTRTPEERAGDLNAQVAAVTLGRRRVEGLIASYGAPKLKDAVAALKNHAARLTRAMIKTLRPGPFRAEAFLDGPGSPKLRVRLERRGGRLRVDFTGTESQIAAPFNANRAITLSAVFYAVRLLVAEELPTNSGCLDPVDVIIPKGSLLDAHSPAPVAGGNVETSQRLVEILLQALAKAAPDRVPAASQGTMNNVTVGGTLPNGRPFTFYETIGGGAGAGPVGPGLSGVQTHMTNTLNTPIEALECAFPLLITRYHLREGSGGLGRHAGGEGIVREFTAKAPCRVTLLATRRKDGAPGVRGGGSGARARDRVRRGARRTRLPESGTVQLEAGESFVVETPGGGGYGRPPDV